MSKIVVMGVAGCGKSSLGRALAHALGLRYIEGDDFHADASIAKMRSGMPLSDADRQGWLEHLAQELTRDGQGGVLACSALKRSYREHLRAASPDLRLVFLDISRELALARVAARAAEHLFPVSLVDSQFATLERPSAEPGVLTLAATLSPEEQLQQALAWFQAART